jgi:hypothetical protein
VSVLDAALYLAKKRGLYNITRDQIARQANVGVDRIGDMTPFRARLVAFAVSQHAWQVVGEALASGHPATARLDAAQKLKAMEAYRGVAYS